MKNDIRNAASVVYNHAAIKRLRDTWGDGWHGAMDLFVNGNEENVENVSQEEFEKGVKFNMINDNAFPVLVYQMGHKMVAWYDEENEYGYIA